MRKETGELLATLSAQYPKRTLLALWSDLRALDKREFEELLGASTKTLRSPRKSPAKRQQLAFHDTPESQIRHLLLTQGGMQEKDAADQLKRQLVDQGVGSSRIPPLAGRQLADWLSALFRSVPASQVMHAALQISGRPAR